MNIVKSRRSKIFLGIGVGVFLMKLYINGGKCVYSRNIEGKTVVVTGSSKGIGKETAIDLARKGAHVIFACRS